MDTQEIITEDGVRLALHHIPAQGSRRGICLATHAMMASSRYVWNGPSGGFAGHLSRAGIEVFALDFRGHGQSQPAATRAETRWCFDDLVAFDLPAAMAAVCAQAGADSRDILYVGHSLGGLAGLAAVGTGAMPRPRAIGLFACSVWLPGVRGSRWRRALLSLYQLSAFPTGRAPIRRLGLGTDNEPYGYVRQLAVWARTGRWQSRDGIDYLARLGDIVSPVWAACGDADRLCRPCDTGALLGRVRRSAPLRVAGLSAGDAARGDHFSLLTRPEHAPLWDELIDFAFP